MNELDNAQKKFYIMNVAGSNSDIVFPEYENKLKKKMYKHSIELALQKDNSSIGSIYFIGYTYDNEKISTVQKLVKDFESQELICNGLLLWNDIASLAIKIAFSISKETSYIVLSTVNYEDNTQSSKIFLSDVSISVYDNVD